MLSAALLACAASIHPVTLQSLVTVESGGNPVSLHVNGLTTAQPHARDMSDAAAIARAYIGRGFRVDLGLAQIDSDWLPVLGLTVEQALEPCTNLQHGGAILAANYRRATVRMGQGRPALEAALGAYNTGSFVRGAAYVRRIEVAANYVVPSIGADTTAPAPIVHKGPPAPPVVIDMLHSNQVAAEPDSGASDLLSGVAPVHAVETISTAPAAPARPAS